MHTEVIAVDPSSPDPRAIERAARLIRAGELVAFPTETVYGLGADALDARAVAKIFEAKERPATNPVIVHVLDEAQAREVVSEWPARAAELAARFWPGPLTLVLPRADAVPSAVSAGLATVAVRAPAHPVARALLAAARRPIAAPSANPATRVSPTTAAHVLAGLDGRIPMILDAGPTDVGIESTVLAIDGARAVLLRPGRIARSELESVVGRIEDAAALAVGDAAPSPGMGERHYAPRARVVLVPRGDAESLERAVRDAKRPAAILRELAAPAGTDARILPRDPDGYARALYAALHDLGARADVIAIEGVPDDDAWDAIRDRITRAAR